MVCLPFATRHSPLASGAIAQLGERELCKLEVVGSIPSGSTMRVGPRPASGEGFWIRGRPLGLPRVFDIVKREHDRSGALAPTPASALGRCGRLCSASMFLERSRNGLSDQPLRGLGYSGSFAAGMDHESDQVPEEHLVDALALRGDEGRGTLR
jgi:hypothetical protein